MKKYIALILIFASCYQPKTHDSMITFSKALPIKFWVNQQLTFNNLDVPGKDKTPFSQKVNLADSLTVQFLTSGAELAIQYELQILTVINDVEEEFDVVGLSEVSAGVQQATFSLEDLEADEGCYLLKIRSIANSSVYLPNNEFNTSLAPWTNSADANNAWIWEAPGQAYASMDGSTDRTKYLSDPLLLTLNDHSIEVVGTITFTAGDCPDAGRLKIYLSNDDQSVLQEIGNVEIDFTTETSPINIAESFNFTPDGLPYTKLSFRMFIDAPSVTDDVVDVKISEFNINLQEEVIHGYSDILDVQESHEETCLTKYTSTKDYAGLVYQGLSPIPSFYIRTTSQFFEVREPENDESESLSSGQILNLSSDIKTQMMLYVEQAPSHIHEIMRRALKHSSIEITNHEKTIEVTKEEKYESEIVDQRNPLMTANCWLTVKDSLETNVFTG